MATWRFVKFLKALIKEVGEDDLSGGAAELAYKLFLALFPFLIFVAALGGFIADALNIQNPTDQLINQIGSSLPADVISVLRKQMHQVVEGKNSALLSVGILGALWSSASGVGTVMKVMNRIYDARESRGRLRRYATAIGLTLVAGVSILASVVLLVVGEAYGINIAQSIGFSGSDATLITLARWPVIVLMLLLAVAVLFWAAPNVTLPFRWLSPGALVFVALWLPFTYFFGLYVANFGSYNATYGTLGGVVVLLVWLYLSSFILLFAAEINAVLAEEAASSEVKKTAEPKRAESEESEPRGLKRRIGRAVPGVALGAGLVGLTAWRAVTGHGNDRRAAQ